jgi:hypothetical protein
MPRTTSLIVFLVPAILSPACASPPPAEAPVVAVPSAAPTTAPTPPTSASTEPSPSPPPAGAFKPPKGLQGGPFGGERWGFVQASSADGRLVVLRRFVGEARPSFGQHGESSTPTEVTVFDRANGTERVIDDVIDVEPSRRFFLVLERGHVLVGDARSGAFVALDKADMEPDHNACLPPRQANFSAEGKRVGWTAADGFHVRDLKSGNEWVVKAKDRLWRGWPDDDGKGATLAEVPAGTTEWPHQNTSCACRWCGRFAMSYGMYGWSGPSFDLVHVAEDGSRKKADPAEGKGSWHGPTTTGCTVEPKTNEHGLDHGPWQWKC